MLSPVDCARILERTRREIRKILPLAEDDPTDLIVLAVALRLAHPRPSSPEPLHLCLVEKEAGLSLAIIRAIELWPAEKPVALVTWNRSKRPRMKPELLERMLFLEVEPGPALILEQWEERGDRLAPVVGAYLEEIAPVVRFELERFPAWTWTGELLTPPLEFVDELEWVRNGVEPRISVEQSRAWIVDLIEILGLMYGTFPWATPTWVLRHAIALALEQDRSGDARYLLALWRQAGPVKADELRGIDRNISATRAWFRNSGALISAGILERKGRGKEPTLGLSPRVRSLLDGAAPFLPPAPPSKLLPRAPNPTALVRSGVEHRAVMKAIGRPLGRPGRPRLRRP